MGLVATMTALLLGLVTAAAKGSFDTQDVAVKNAAAGIMSLDRLLARYGPETKPSRDLLRQALADRLEAMFYGDPGCVIRDPKGSDPFARSDLRSRPPARVISLCAP